jgi:hypothetical protein
VGHEWCRSGAMSYPRIHCACAGLARRRVVAIGGLACSHAGGSPSASVEVLDPTTMIWSGLPPLLKPTVSCASCVLRDDDDPAVTAQLRRTDAGDGGPMPMQRRSERVVVTGGSGHLPHDAGGMTDVWVLDMATQEWTEFTHMSEPRHSHSCSALPGGRVLVAGGKRGTAILSTVEVFCPRLSCWCRMPPMPVAVASHAALVMSKGRCAIFGGWDGKQSLSSVHMIINADRAQHAGLGPPVTGQPSMHPAPVECKRSPPEMPAGSQEPTWQTLSPMPFRGACLELVPHPYSGQLLVVVPDEASQTLAIQPLQLSGLSGDDWGRGARGPAWSAAAEGAGRDDTSVDDLQGGRCDSGGTPADTIFGVTSKIVAPLSVRHCTIVLGVY